MLEDFKKFLMRGNVVDLAVGLIMALAFGKIVTSLVNDIVMPPIGLLLGRVDFSSLYINLSGRPFESLAAASCGCADDQLRRLHQLRHRIPIVGSVLFQVVRQLNRITGPLGLEHSGHSSDDEVKDAVKEQIKERETREKAAADE
ncbi:MAG: large conductance mechanosensitive channel protein MscL [Vicinamibacterales bacterium]